MTLPKPLIVPTTIPRDEPVPSIPATVGSVEPTQAARLVPSIEIPVQVADPEAAQNLVDRISGLRVTGFAETDGTMTPNGTFTVTDDAGSNQLRIYHDAEEDAYAIESDRTAGRFAISTYIAEQMIVAEQDLRIVADAEEALPDD